MCTELHYKSSTWFRCLFKQGGLFCEVSIILQTFAKKLFSPAGREMQPVACLSSDIFLQMQPFICTDISAFPPAAPCRVALCGLAQSTEVLSKNFLHWLTRRPRNVYMLLLKQRITSEMHSKMFPSPLSTLPPWSIQSLNKHLPTNLFASPAQPQFSHLWNGATTQKFL